MGMIVRGLMALAYLRIAVRDKVRLACQTPTPGIVREMDIPYLPDGQRMHLLDIYYPAGTEELLPTIFDIHGGGWVYGSKDNNRNYCRWLAARGYTVVCINYRLIPQVDLRGQVQDVMAALRWTAQNGEAHHCDLSRLFLTGDSAGGHMASLAMCLEQSRYLRDIYKTPAAGVTVRALGLSHAVCNFSPQNPAEGLLVKEMFPLMFGSKPERAPWFGNASLPETAERLATLPPIFMVTSNFDPFHKESLIVEHYLRGRGADYAYLCWTRQQGDRHGHIFHVKHPRWPESAKANRAMLTFFEQAAKNAGVPYTQRSKE